MTLVSRNLWHSQQLLYTLLVVRVVSAASQLETALYMAVRMMQPGHPTARTLQYK